MAFTLVKGTIHTSLNVFDFELTRTACSDEFKEKNGLVVSLPIKHGIRYIDTLKTNRTVQVEGDENKTLYLTFYDNHEAKAGYYIHYLDCARHTKEVLNFLLTGVLPNVEQTGS